MRQRCPPSTQGARGPVREPGGALLEDLRGRHSPAHMVPMYLQRQQHCGTVRGPAVIASHGTGSCGGHSGHHVAASRTHSVGCAGANPQSPQGRPLLPAPPQPGAWQRPIPGSRRSQPLAPGAAGRAAGQVLCWKSQVFPGVVSLHSGHAEGATQHRLSVPGTPSTFWPGPGSGLHGDRQPRAGVSQGPQHCRLAHSRRRLSDPQVTPCAQGGAQRPGRAQPCYEPEARTRTALRDTSWRQTNPVATVLPVS